MKKKCAIYNRYSVNNDKMITENRNKLIKYCKEKLQIDDFVLFEEIGSVNGERKEFNNMIEQIHKGMFTDLLVIHPNRIYRAEYNKEKFDQIINDIVSNNVELHSIMNRERQREL